MIVNAGAVAAVMDYLSDPGLKLDRILKFNKDFKESVGPPVL